MDDTIDRVLDEFAKRREAHEEGRTAGSLAWTILESGDIGLLRAAVDNEGNLLLQNLNLSDKWTCMLSIAPATIPALKALLEGL